VGSNVRSWSTNCPKYVHAEVIPVFSSASTSVSGVGDASSAAVMASARRRSSPSVNLAGATSNSRVNRPSITTLAGMPLQVSHHDP